MSEKPKTSGRGDGKKHATKDMSIATFMVQNQLSRLASAYDEVETYRAAIVDQDNKTRLNYRKLEEAASRMNKEMVSTTNRLHVWRMVFEETDLAPVLVTISRFFNIEINAFYP